MISQTESSRAQDLWSCGVITYIMLCGYPPFFKNQQDKSESKLLRQIVKGRYHFHDNFWGHISEEAKHFVSRLMCADPKLRLTAEEATMRLNIPTGGGEPVVFHVELPRARYGGDKFWSYDL